MAIAEDPVLRTAATVTASDTKSLIERSEGADLPLTLPNYTSSLFLLAPSCSEVDRRIRTTISSVSVSVVANHTRLDR